MKEIERKVIETDQRARANQHRIERLEETTQAVQELAASTKMMAQTLENMTEELKAQGERLAALELQPGERWNSMTKAVLTTVTSTIAGGLMGALIALLV